MRKIFCLFTAALLGLPNLSAQQRYEASWESLKKYQVPDWFRDAKFGIFIHWGVYSVPAFVNEWYANHMYDTSSTSYTHHLSTYGTPDTFGYKDFIPKFRAEKFDPAAWVALFKKAGAKYVVPVAEHHDGFAMYQTSMSRWNAVEMGPKRDIIDELAKATRNEGLIFGLSSHRIEHWWFLGGGKGFASDVRDPRYADFYGPARSQEETMSPEFMNDWLLRSTELVDKYRPQLLWFDWWIEQPELTPYRKTFAAYYYNKAREWNKGVVINYKYDKAFPQGAAVLDLERGKLNNIREPAWQTDDAIGNNSWGYTVNNTFKSPEYVIHHLIDIVSKNGNLLLNIGPKADGTITDEETNVLLNTGKWLAVNGEAIYGTRPWNVFGEGPTESANGPFQAQEKPFTARDIRFTSKGGQLYALILGIPTGEIAIQSLSAKAAGGNIANIELLGSAETVKWKQTNNALLIKAANSYPAEHAAAYKISFQ